MILIAIMWGAFLVLDLYRGEFYFAFLDASMCFLFLYANAYIKEVT